jgi:CRP/FNR family cyclic AMP-dependent transcriptional regulator
MQPAVLLRKFPLFNGIADLTLVSLEAQIRWIYLNPEEIVCRKGDVSDGLYILIRGSLLVFDLLYNGQEVSLNVLSSGDFFGELSVIDHLPRTAYIKATQKSLVGLLPKPVAQDLFYKNPMMAQLMMEHLTAKVREMTIQRVLLSLPNALQRVCAWLEHSKVTTPGGEWVVHTTLKQHDLANMLNTSRETVSRCMTRLTRDGVITRDSKGLRVLNPALLAKLAQQDSPPLLNPSRNKPT